MSFSVPSSAQSVELIKAVHLETETAVISTEVPPPSATLTIGVATGEPRRHSGQKLITAYVSQSVTVNVVEIEPGAKNAPDRMVL